MARASEILLPWDGAPHEIVGPSVDLLGEDASIWTAQTKAWAGRFNRTLQSEGSFFGYTPSHLGRGAAWTRATSGGAEYGLNQPLSSDTGVTMAVVAAPLSSGGIKVLASQRSGSGNVPQMNFMTNATAAFGADAGAAMLYCRNNAAGVTPVIAAGGNGGVDGDVHCWVAGNSAAGGYMFRDGEALTLGTNTAMTGTYVDTTQGVRIGNLGLYSSDGNFVSDNPIYFVAWWPRLIPEKLARELSRILVRSLGPAFEPRAMPTFYESSSAYPVLSAATVINITATTAVPRVTITI